MITGADFYTWNQNVIGAVGSSISSKPLCYNELAGNNQAVVAQR